jgi:hypothetical protein
VADGGCLENNCVGRPTPWVRIPRPPLNCSYIATDACSDRTGGAMDAGNRTRPNLAVKIRSRASRQGGRPRKAT